MRALRRYIGFASGVLGVIGLAVLLIPSHHQSNVVLQIIMPVACFLPIVSLIGYLRGLWMKNRWLVGRAWVGTLVTGLIVHLLIFGNRFYLSGFDRAVLGKACLTLFLLLVFCWLLLQGYLSLFAEKGEAS